MSAMGLVFSVLAALLAAATIVGQARTGRLHAAWLLVAYLGVSVMVRPPLWLWPDRFYNWGYWLATDLLQTALALGAAIEINWRAYGHLPPGRRRAAGLALAVCLITLAAALALRQPGGLTASHFYFQAAEAVAHVTAGAAFLFALFVGLAWWYELPTDPFHQDIAGGFILWSLLMACGSELAVLDPYLGRGGMLRVAHVVVLGAWALAAWRRPPSTTLDPAVLAFLHPWRRAA